MPFAAGGHMLLAYSNGTDRYELALTVAPFDASTCLYTGGGLTAPTEAGLADTFARFGVVWAPYFDSSWSLTMEAIYHRNGGDSTRLAGVPSGTAIPGTSPIMAPVNPAIRRGFTFLSRLANRERIRLFGISSEVIGAARITTPNSGGFDARDRILIGYVSGSDTGLVFWDGYPFPPSARVYQRFQLRPFERAGPAPPPSPAPTGPGGARVPPGTDGDILVYWHGTWTTLDATAQGQQLTLDYAGTALRPLWTTPCCAEAAQKSTGTDPWTGDAGSPADWGRCGAAVAMAAWLEQYYANVLSLYNAVALAGGVIGVATLAAKVLDAGRAANQLSWLDWLEKKVPPVAKFLINRLAGLIGFRALTDTQKRDILMSLYCALASVSGPSDITEDTIALWSRNIVIAFGADFTIDSRSLLALLLMVPGLGTWRLLATRGAAVPTSLCSSFDCGAGSALVGGAYLAPLGRALRGGAAGPGAAERSIRGGATYGIAQLHAMTGGATIS